MLSRRYISFRSQRAATLSLPMTLSCYVMPFEIPTLRVSLSLGTWALCWSVFGLRELPTVTSSQNTSSELCDVRSLLPLRVSSGVPPDSQLHVMMPRRRITLNQQGGPRTEDCWMLSIRYSCRRGPQDGLLKAMAPQTYRRSCVSKVLLFNGRAFRRCSGSDLYSRAESARRRILPEEFRGRASCTL